MSRFRENVEGRYEFRPDEVELVAAIEAADAMIERLEAAWVDLGMPMMTLGSMKQEIIHPLIGELRNQRAAKARLMAQLKLPDDVSAPADGSSGARKAATARWSRGA